VLPFIKDHTSDKAIFSLQKERPYQLMDSSKLEDYKISIPVDAQLRKYQQVNLLCIEIP
jgi:hypothetical protein